MSGGPEAQGPALEAILARAFRRARPQDANTEIGQVRAERATGRGREVVSYEVVVPPGAGTAFLVEKVLPRLVYFLDCRGVKAPRTDEVFMSIFAGEGLYFLTVEALLEELSKAAGFGYDEMVRRWGAQSV